MNIFLKNTLKKIVEELQEEETKKAIFEDIVTPILKKFSDKIYPYVTLLFVMYTINLILIIAILFIIIMTRNVV